jgi:acetyl-CoA acetyltransferase
MSDVTREPTEKDRQLAEHLRGALGRLNRSLRLTQAQKDLSSSNREVLMGGFRGSTESTADPFVAICLVGFAPVLMLTGPIIATRKLLEEQKKVMNDIDVTEINEAFASVVLAWEREMKSDIETVNPNGGAIALGHPLGATGQH